jgi:hypothetical protein
MEVTLSKRSWHYALNRWSLEKDPQTWSLCPYFWMTIYFILTAPLRVIGRYLIIRPLEWIFVPRGERSWEERKPRSLRAERALNKTEAFLDKTEIVVRRSLGAIIVGTLLLGFIGLLIHGFMKEGWKVLWEMLILIGFSMGVVLCMGFIAWVFSKIGKSDTWTALKGMFYSIKNKVCPAINWKETNQNA